MDRRTPSELAQLFAMLRRPVVITPTGNLAEACTLLACMPSDRPMPANAEVLQKILNVLEEEHSLVAEVTDHDLTADEVLMLLASLGKCQARTREHFSTLAGSLGLPTNARDRILRYLQLRVGTVVDKEELGGVSGIYEWARRLRELRDDEGWDISTMENRPDLRPGQYVLESLARHRRG